MSETSRLVTAGELERFPDDDHRYELVEGRLIRVSPVGYAHARIVARLCQLLGQHARDRNLGVVVTEMGVKLASNPDTVRAPDVAFIRQERIPSIEPRGFWNGPPDLAIEVLSPDDRPADVRAKIDEYLGHGVLVAVVIDPDRKTVATTRAGTPPAVLNAYDERLDLGDVVDGFTCELREIFG